MFSFKSLVATMRRPWLVVLIAAIGTVPPLAAQEKKVPNKAEKQQSYPPKFSPLPKVFKKSNPETLEELKAIEKRVREIVRKVTPAVVNVRIGAGQGSGVIVSEDGYILTAGHVSGPANRTVVITMADGTRLRGKTLGANRRVDSGMIKITKKGKYPFVKMGKSGNLRKGQWCLAIGHPGGYRKGRTPVVRLGRILANFTRVLRSDCALVGGDSGGPLFDMNGNVIGIHSRIGPSITSNMHVPVDIYTKSWDELVRGDVLELPKKGSPYIGVEVDPDGKNAKVLRVYPGLPADKAGIKAGDIIVKFAGRKIKSFSNLAVAVSRQKPGEKVEVVVLRDGERVTLNLVIGRKK